MVSQPPRASAPTASTRAGSAPPMAGCSSSAMAAGGAGLFRRLTSSTPRHLPKFWQRPVRAELRWRHDPHRPQSARHRSRGSDQPSWLLACKGDRQALPGPPLACGGT
ncbi:hypothetical protein G6F50_016399 [Rhizopus delemar]|uniref:Uncharacterized protein n=1 Tax=Rhizopus delemar TaxID=936053 RepID=A0A9P7C1A3_9FUNG|nr:hypothetical protein G6F50_016399 [Rhizopus delemar]